MEIQTLWREVMAGLGGKLSANDVACWAAAIHPRELRGRSLAAEVPSRVHLEQARSRVAPEITSLLRAYLGPDAELVLSVNDGRERPPRATFAGPSPFQGGYTFEQFVVGASNSMAYHSAREVADHPATRYNPLFLYGGVGLGKTHLATAIAHAVWREAPRRRIVLLSAENFTNDLIRAFRGNAPEEFRTRLRRADLLIVDDVQFFAGKERMQEEFFHTFNALHAAQKQIVLASDQPPRNIPNLEERLRNRFESGLITDIRRPDLTLRMAILARKATTLRLELPADVAHLIASKVVSSVRELEGALRRLVAACEIDRRTLDLGFATQILRPLLRAPVPRTLEQVQRLVASRFQVSEADLVCRRRVGRLVVPRQVAMYLARKGTSATYAEIAAGFGGRNHSTVMHAIKVVEGRRAAEPEFAEVLETLESDLQTA